MRKILIVILSLFVTKAIAQDPQFSQYYNAPLILNPALAGATDCYRLGLNARSQWTSLPGGAFNTGSVFVDLNYPDIRSGFGLLAVHDYIGTPRMTTNEISGFYSYIVPVTSLFNVRFGLQGTYANRSLNYSKLRFEDQFTGTLFTNQYSTDPITAHPNVNYMDVSAGAVVFGEDKYWVGLAAHHLTEPEQGFYQNAYLPRKYSVHGGYNFFLKKKKKVEGIEDMNYFMKKNPKENISMEEVFRIIPTFMYKSQTRFDQLDLGCYFMNSTYMLGIWYRGIALKKDFNILNNDAIDVQAGVHVGNISLTYSYDFTTSKLNIRNTHGSHELSLIYLFCLDWPNNKKPNRKVRKLPCPDFKRSMKYKKNFLGF